MYTSLLHHGFGISSYDYINTKYQGGAVTFTLQPKPFSLRCSQCRSRKVIRRGIVSRLFRTLQMGLDRKTNRISWTNASISMNFWRLNNFEKEFKNSIYYHKLT